MWIAAQQNDEWLHVWIVDTDDVTALGAPVDGSSSFEQQVIALSGPYLDASCVRSVVCAGAPDAPFLNVPAAPSIAQQVPSDDARTAFFLVPRMVQAQPADMMQGQEATIAGFITQHPDWDGVLCLAGASTRWVHISAGEVVSFRSFLTGEMFGVLSVRSSLQHALVGAEWDGAAFESAVGDAMSRPERMTQVLASVRAQAFLAQGNPAIARAQVSGTLIGIELAAARPYWLGQNIAIVGDGEIAIRYEAALGGQGAMAARYCATGLALAGLRQAHSRLGRS